jgi:hypothetical protein
VPIRVSTFQLPSGDWAARMDCFGTIGKEDGESWLKQVEPGGPFHELPTLAVTLEIEHITSEGRNSFIRRGNARTVWVAVVVTRPLVRVTANFAMRVSGNKKYRLFATEREAVLWLDERVREDAAQQVGP